MYRIFTFHFFYMFFFPLQLYLFTIVFVIFSWGQIKLVWWLNYCTPTTSINTVSNFVKRWGELSVLLEWPSIQAAEHTAQIYDLTLPMYLAIPISWSARERVVRISEWRVYPSLLSIKLAIQIILVTVSFSFHGTGRTVDHQVTRPR